MSAPYRLLSRRTVCENARFEICFDTLEKRGGGLVHDYLIVKPKVMAPDGTAGVCVLPRVDDRIGLMRAYRHQFDEFVWQAPAGFIDHGENGEQCARRELFEETGLVCPDDALKSLSRVLPDAGIIQASILLYLAADCRQDRSWRDQSQEVGASALEWFSSDELGVLLASDAPIGSATMTACLKYLAL